MKGDFSRNTFRPDRHYSGVRMQQGRVQLDADWNEQIDIQAHRDETVGKDLIGPSGAPSDNPGFEITPEGNNLKIGQGRYYVDGILCDNKTDVYYAEQPNMEEQPDLPRTSLPTVNGPYLAYLDVWQRHITSLEDPDIREVALGGPDTTTRTKTVWQVKLLPLANVLSDAHSLTTFSEWTDLITPPHGQLRARSEPGQPSSTLQAIEAGEGYQRLENQLYRVEIHTSGGPDEATFKWSRDNGSVVTSWTAQSLSGSVLTIGNLGRDQMLGFAPGQWVELTDDDRELWSEPGIMVQIQAAGERSLTIRPADEGRIYLTDNAAQESATSLSLSSSVAGISLPTFAVRTAGSAGVPTVQLLVSNAPLILAADGEFATLESDLNELTLIDGKLIDGNTIEIAGSLPEGTSVTGTFTYGEDNDGTTVQALIDAINSVFTGGATATLAPGYMPQRANFGTNPKVRRWDSVKDEQVPVPTNANDWIELEGGVEIQFTSGDYRTGDCWLIPARTVAADVLWPEDENKVPLFQPPHGIVHHYARLGLVDSDGSIFSNVKDWRRLFSAATDLELRYISGDGQEAMPGEQLPQFLRVGVFGGGQPVEGATVRFEIRPLSDNSTRGGLRRTDNPSEQTETALELTADVNGIAECTWELPVFYDQSNPDELTRLQVEATLQDADGERLGLPVVFSASFSLAERVAYDTTSDSDLNLPAADDVQEVITQLRENHALYYVGGDGQEAMPDEMLPQPLAVRVMNGRWPVEQAQIIFSKEPGSGSLTGSAGYTSSLLSETRLMVTTDSDGLALCNWTLDDSPHSQQVKAVYIPPTDPPEEVGPIFFHANLSIASEVAFDPTTGAEQILTDPQVVPTVQKALEVLDVGKVNRSGDTITGDLTVDGKLGVGGTSPDEKLFVDGNVRIQGDLVVDGAPTEIDRTQIRVEDNILTVNKFDGGGPNPTLTAGLEVFRGDEPLAQLLWDETEDFWKIGVDGDLKEVATVDQLPSGVARTIYQQTHDFEVGDIIYFDAATTLYAKATASDSEKTGLFMVSETGVDPDADADHNRYFTLVQAGYVEGLSGLTPGEYYYVSDDPAQAGSLTPVEPLRISNPIFLADTAESGYVLPYRPSESIQHELHTLRVLQADPDAPDGALFVDQAGHLGIGTTTPNGELHIHDSDTAFTSLVFSHKDTGTAGTFGGEVSLLNDDLRVVNKEPGNLYLGTDNSFDLTIAPGGNVGIGKTPGAEARLDISGNAKVSGTIFADGDVLDFPNKVRKAKIKLWGERYHLGIQSGTMRFGAGSRFRYYFGETDELAKQTCKAVMTSKGLRVGDSSDPGKQLDVIGDAYISGNVGIGTTGPEQKLVVSDGKVGIGYNNAAQTAALAVNGDVGIGTPSPGAKLDVRGDINIPFNKLRFDSGVKKGTAGIASTDTGRIYGEHDENTETSRLVLEIRDNKNDAIVLRTAANDFRKPSVDMIKVADNVCLVPAQGKVGIGTPSPGAMLDVNGTLKAKEVQTKLYSVTPMSSVELSSDNKWKNFLGLSKSISLAHATNVIVFYQITMGGGGSHLVTRLNIDGEVMSDSRAITGNTTYWSPSNIWIGRFSAGDHTVTVQYRTPAGGANHPASSDWHNRVLKILILGN